MDVWNTDVRNASLALLSLLRERVLSECLLAEIVATIGPSLADVVSSLDSDTDIFVNACLIIGEISTLADDLWKIIVRTLDSLLYSQSSSVCSNRLLSVLQASVSLIQRIPSLSSHIRVVSRDLMNFCLRPESSLPLLEACAEFVELISLRYSLYAGVFFVPLIYYVGMWRSLMRIS